MMSCPISHTLIDKAAILGKNEGMARGYQDV